MRLSDKYGIPIYGTWEHKDGGKYSVLDVKHIGKNHIRIPIVIYSKDLTAEEITYNRANGISNFFARDLYQFKKNFKEIE